MKARTKLGLGIIAASVLGWVPLAHADSCETPCAPCSIEERCPKSGVSCTVVSEGDAGQCGRDAEAAGLELRCERADAIYCAPDEELYTGEDEDDGGATEDDGCAVRRPRSRPRGLEAALVTFAVAAAATAYRAARRRGR